MRIFVDFKTWANHFKNLLAGFLETSLSSKIKAFYAYHLKKHILSFFTHALQYKSEVCRTGPTACKIRC